MNAYQELFLSGAHSVFVEQHWDRLDSQCPLESLHLLLGSLCFLGRPDEAEVLLERHESELLDLQRAQAYFFLTIGFSRTGSIPKATPFLRKLGHMRHLEAPIRFWLFQALGFLRFVSCRYQKALDLMVRAQRLAVASQDFYARALASDLKGHAQIAVGEVFLGLKSLEQAHAYFQGLGNEGHARTIARALTTYRAKHSIDATESLAGLKHLLAELQQEENNFSLAGTYLEIARIYSLSGQLHLAESTLDKAGEIIHRDGLDSYTLLLEFRRAYLFLLRGKAAKTLRILRQLQPKPFDLRSQVQILGLQQAAEAILQDDTDDRQQQKRNDLLNKSGYSVSQRIECRLKAMRKQSWGKDPLGDLLDDLHDMQYSREEKLERLESHGYWTFAYEVLGIPRDQPCLVLNALPGLILVFDHGQVEAQKLQLHSQIAKLFQILAQGAANREALVAGLWGYAYNPLRHDTLIYGLMSRVRSLLGTAEGYLVMSEAGHYHLRSDFKVIQMTSSWQDRMTEEKVETLAPLEPTPPLDVTIDINQRQRKILRYLDHNESIDLSKCLSLFDDVSKVTMSRDLSQLVERNLLIRTGRARNTSYILNQTPASREGQTHA